MADAPITLRKIAADCIKSVRSVVSAEEGEEVAIELVTNIWNTLAVQTAHGLKVGKSMSLMPLGVLFMHGKEPQLAISELFIMQYGISMKPGELGSPGPSTKPAHGEIAAAVHIADKAIIPNVISAVMNRFGEMCSQHPVVQMDFAPLGEFICEQQRLEFVPAQQHARVAPQSTEPGRTVRSMLQRKRNQVDKLSANGTQPEVPTLPLRQQTNAAEMTLPAEDLLASQRSLVHPASVVANMVGKRADLAGPQHTLSPRQPHGISRSLAGLGSGAGAMESKGILQAQFVRSQPAKTIDFPPLLDEFSRTLAAPYAEELHHGSSSGRIAAHLSPMAAMLAWSHETKCLKWRTAPAKEGQGKGPQPEFAPAEVLEREFANLQIPQGSPLDLELKEAKLAKRTFYGGLLRYNYYVTEGIRDSEVAPINTEWVDNVGFLVEAERLFKDLADEVEDEILAEVTAEMKAGYLAASKKAIADYIFKDPHSRDRALVPIVPAPVPDWGSVPFVGIEGTVGGPPDEWRDGIDENRDAVVRTLTVCNQSSLRLLHLWHGTGYGAMLLVELPPLSSDLVDIDHFTERQKGCCMEVFTKFKSQWLEEVCAILREENLHLRSPTETRFFRGILALLSLQTRQLVSQTVQAFTDFIMRYADPNPLKPEAVVQLKDTDERQSAFLVVKLIPKGDEVRLKDSTEKVVERILRVFREFVLALNDIASPEIRVAADIGRATGKDNRTLWPTALDEQYVQQAERLIEKTVQFNMANAMEAVHLYDDYIFLLSEEEKIREFVQDSSKTIPDYLAKFDALRAVDRRIREKLPRDVRLQMVCVECVELNQTLQSRAAECLKLLLDNVVQVNFERNERLCKTFESIMTVLTKKPTSAGELVDLEQQLEQFRAVTLKELLEEFGDIRAWQQMLFDCQHLLTPRDFKAVTETATWVHQIDGRMQNRETSLRTERDGIENKFRKERQEFEENLSGYLQIVNKFKDLGNVKQMEDYLEHILALKENLERSRFDAEKYREKEVLLGWDASEFEKLTEATEKLQPYDDLWELVYKFSNEEKKWMRGPLFSIEPEAVDQAANTMARRAMKLQATFESLNLQTPAGVARKIKKDLDSFKQHLPLLHALCNPGLRQRHWEEISEVVGFSMERDAAFTLSRVLDMDVGKHMNELQEISDSASREYGLETTLESIMEQWQPVNFELKPWKDTETYIVAATTVDEMQGLMDDHIIKAQTMKGSPYAKAFMDRIVELEMWLLQTQEIMDIWVKVQGVWLYLEPIFSSEDIVKQMPNEAALFQQVDSDWRLTMSSALEKGKAMEVTKEPGLLERLQKSNENLETVQKGLNDYLEMKRLKFPRFFFLSNDNLLEILSETKDPTRVNPHMKKAFEGIQSLEFQPDHKITGMTSSEKERVPLVNPVDPATARGSVELWLVEVEAAMLESIRHTCLQSAEDYKERKFTEWVKNWPGQAVIAIFGLYWTMEVATGLRTSGNEGIARYGDKMKVMLSDVIDLVRNDIPALTRCTLEALIVIFVHNKDTVEELVKLGISAEDDFDWLVQLRYYIEENPEKPEQRDMFVRITNSFLGYAYEYLGNSSRLIITPLTDRCYRTCCGALHLLYGAAPEGPAGTGKTETVKDLAKALARFCVVFNCSDELDYLAMAKFFKGLAASGGWACFDEFNRIDAEVLSVIAQQILSIQNAIKEKKTRFEFEGTDLPIVWTCNCFITMNPGYAGRAELPDNLKALFRTVAMMVPDYAMIAEIKLYSYGYEDSRSLSQKIVTTYKLCSEQLSSQKHYDYGMRAVFAVLVRAGSLKRKEPNQNESILMLQSVNDVNLAKFLDFDVPLYDGITKDLFPGVTLPKPDYSLMVDKLKVHLDVSYCQPHPYFIDKIIQFYECHLVRHSVMLVGMPFSGKTTALNTLQKALTDLANEGSMHAGCIVHQARLNPKSIPARDLYGCFDEVSHEWTDGIVAVLFRDFARIQTEERKWLVFDGPVDAVWIENMNTVMDENKKLCLNSGEIIAMSANMRTIIEPMDVEVASPATISRNGMVFFEPHLMGFHHLVEKTLKGGLPQEMDEGERTNLATMIEFLLAPLISFVLKQCKTVSPVQEQNLVQAFLSLLITHLQQGYKAENMARETADPKAIIAMCDCYAVWSAIWGIGATCETNSRPMFGQFLRKLLTGQADNSPKPPKKLQPALPDRGSVFDYVVDVKIPVWTTWIETVEPQVIPNSAQVQSIIVQTVDNVRYRYVLDHCIKHEMKLLFCGPTGTGKTVYMQQALMSMPKETHMQIQIGFSAQTKCSQTQDLVDAKLDRRRKGIYGPPNGRKCVVLVDDLNMPVKEKYGAMPPIEILRQCMDSIAYGPTGGWFDRKDSTHPFRSIVDVIFFAAMGPPGGGRSFITPRIVGHLYMVGFPLLDDENLVQVFSTILDWKFKADNYPSDVAGLSKKIVQATLEIYKSTSNELRPTPMKVHYTFNLRDFSKVVCGLLMLKKSECEGTDRHVRLWIHEILRVFGDRLIDDIDREWMLLQLRDQTKKVFQVSFDDVLSHLDMNKDGKVNTLDEVRTLFFGDMLAPAAAPQRPYTECPDVVILQKEIEGHLNAFNEMSSKPMDLVCFLYMLEHLARAARVIKTPGGNALLVGVGGSGRHSCTRLACFMADYTVFEIEIAKGYDMTAFREDMKKMLTKAGGQDLNTVFLFSDTQIKDEGFVEDVNNLLNTGEIPNLFPAEERVAICEMVRKAAADEGKAPDGSLTQLFAFFVERCRALVGCVVCFSPIGDNWRTRLRQFPSLVNCCTIDWYTSWPADALTAVATKFLQSIPDLDDNVRHNCVEMCQFFHSETKKLAARFEAELKRIYYSTPTSFLELIQTFKDLLAQKRASISSLKSKYEVGLDKLTTTELSVESMKQDLIALQPQLVEKNKEVGEMMVVVNEESAKTEKVKEVVAADEAVASEAASQANGIKEECEAALEEAMPALNEALKALDTLSAKEIAEVKAMKNPAAPVRLVLSAVCVLRNVKPVRVKDESGKMVDDYWPAAVKMISEMGFLQSLQTFDKDNMAAATVKRISEMTVKEDFQPDRVDRVSHAAWGLCMWVRAMETYDRVAKVVQPKKEQLAAAEAELNLVMEKLNAKRAELKAVQDKLDGLNGKLSSLRQEQDDLTCQVDLCQKKLERAETLIASLGGEKTRWTQNAKDLSADYINLTGDVIVAAGLIAYLGAFTPEFREGAVTSWAESSREREIPGSEKFSLDRCLGEPVKIRAWVIAGLPNDAFSIENGIVVDKARRWPLCIDPQGQANRWIKKMGQPNQIVIAKFSDSDYLKRLEGCIQFGNPMLIENILEDTDPAVEPVLLRQTFKKGNTLMIKLGEAIIEWQKDFKLFLTTKLRNPHYLPEVAVKVTLLNFMITQVGLQDQLLNIVVERERPDLAEEKARLVVEGAENKEQLEVTENKILDVLSSSQGNILDDEEAVQVLSASKQLSNEIAEKQKVAETTEVQIDEARLQYVPVAYQTAILFFCIADLANIDPMYQYSLPFFINLFKSAIDKSEKSADIAKRIDILNDFFMEQLYKNICRSLFEKHKLLFSFLLTMRLQVTMNKVAMTDYRFLLTGGTAMEEPPSKPATWIPDRMWAELFKLSKVSEHYQPLIEAFDTEIKEWKDVYDSADPLRSLTSLNAPKSMESMSEFQELMVLRCVRPDRVLPAVLSYVSSQAGEKFVTPPPFDIAGSYSDSSITAPLIFILSPGSDPSSALYMFATEKGRDINSLSLGQGQGPKAEKLLAEATSSGSWVLLQNCHLFASWMPKLDKILEQMDPKQTANEFRLWLTSYPSDKFPVSILQNSVKITNEAPQGLRANLIGSFLMDPISNEEFFESCKNPTAFKKLLYSLCFFHAVIQERRLFGPLGWNIPYEFTQNDLRISARQLQMFIDESPDSIQFKAINYLTGECNYGGRVTEGLDRRLLMTLLRDYYTADVLTEGHSLCAEHEEFKVIGPSSLEGTVEKIREMPLIIPPGVYGFHANANLTREQNETYAMMENLLLTVGQSGGGGGSSQEETVGEAANDILRRLPAPWDLPEVQKKYPTMYKESMNTVLVQELTRFNNLIQVIASTLRDIQKAVQGLLLMSLDLEQVFLSIFNGKTPAMWLANSYPSLKPLGGYTNDLVERLKFFQTWIDTGIPLTFWISGIYFTQAFTTGASQNFARKYTIPIDTLTFDFEMPEDQHPTERPENGVYCYGVFLEGCKWDWDKWELAESDPKVLYVPVPIIWIVPCKQTDLGEFPSYECPLYKVSTRKGVLSTTGHSTNYVMPIRLSSSAPESHWVKRGVAMLTSLDA
eukprot:TRINITY_DN23765_c0_g1_i1.p1 TRINITY_DN23765_c0_g1~~TRINITY_DN23765_c0_g1_i1.p1  ORF type:complete len:4302 (-),score=866.21 TRINITY_DN23765_c0_g1_i1:110-13015(-)